MLFILSLFINMAAAASMQFLVLTMIVRIVSFSDVNFDANLSDIEVQEFSKAKSGESEPENSKSDNNSTASDEP